MSIVAGSALELSGIFKAYKRGKERVPVLNDISLRVSAGEFVTLLGPSGSGKSTLFRLIGGVEHPDQGRVLIDGKDVTGQRGLISYMPQQAALFPWLTVEDNILTALVTAGTPKREAKMQASDWLERIHLGGVAKQYPHILSGGMQQRVSFLRALLMRRNVMCLDEPFAALDALTREDMQRWLLQLWEADRRSVLFVTHSIEEALLLSDRIYVFSSAPARVIREIVVPFDRPRRADVWTDPAFVALKQEVLSVLERGQASLFDTHIHLDLYPEEERERILESLSVSGVEGLVSVSMGMESCVANREFALRSNGRVMPAYGRHPEQPALQADEIAVMCEWIREKQIVGERFAIGEVGLPYYSRKEAEAKGEFFDLQPYMSQLEAFVRLAGELDLPIVLHAVYEDADPVLDLLERYSIRRAHFHWFKGSPNSIARLVKNGCMVSVTPDLLYEQEIRELAAVYPLDHLMVETDGPWPFEGPFEGKGTEPIMIQEIIREIAVIRGLDEVDLRSIVRHNSVKFYGWT